MAVLRKVLILLLLLMAAPLRAQAPEYDLKAAFLFNFAKFVEWPAGAFAGDRAPLTICVYGEDPFGATLDEVVRDERVGERSLLVQRPDSVNDLRECHVLFVSRSEKDRLGDVMAEVKGKPVLTVADMDGFLRAGGIINFVLEGSKVRFLIDQEAAGRSGLQISSKLMRLAVNTGGR
ncbi:MAG: hypothetical protein QOH06_3956 [Acidobacteriota bacterium]|jgi:hypothetical protein|nr:hypothetical protein [Acidobacteriota bacterium]